MENVKITLLKSLSGRNKKHIETAKSLGLNKVGVTVIQPDNEQTRGKIGQISYLIKVEDCKEG